jgi:FkbM family methyltransferase
MDFNLALKKIFRVAGLEVKRYNFLSAEEPLLKKIISDYHIQTVIDVGANEGQYALQLLNSGYRGNLFSFEPISAPFNVLKARSKGKAKWEAVHAAIGKEDGTLTINVTENIVSSSLYPVGENSISVEPTTRTVRQEDVKVTTIDTFFSGELRLKGEVLLKLDVQGFELEALKGALKNLKNIKIIQIELSFVPLYEGAPLFVEVVSFLEKEGFEIFTILPGFRDRSNGKLLQADGIFIRKT